MLVCAALRPDKARDRFVLASLVASFLLTVALCLTRRWQPDPVYHLPEPAGGWRPPDGLSRLFSLLMSGMWLLSGAFSFGYMAHEGAQRRFYTFYLLTLSALLGLCFAGTLVTMYLCFELMTLLSVALVLHSLTKEAVAAGNEIPAVLHRGRDDGSAGHLLLHRQRGNPLFVAGGTLSPDAVAAQGPLLLWVLLITVIGFRHQGRYMFPMPRLAAHGPPHRSSSGQRGAKRRDHQSGRFVHHSRDLLRNRRGTSCAARGCRRR